jgi:hypothetical protein
MECVWDDKEALNFDRLPLAESQNDYLAADSHGYSPK